MKNTDISERGLESLIISDLTGMLDRSDPSGKATREISFPYDGAGYIPGDPQGYDREHAIDLVKLLSFLQETQPQAFTRLGLGEDGPRRREFLARLQGEIAKRGVIDVLRKGVQHKAASVSLFYGAPSPGNLLAQQHFAANAFSVTRQLRYSPDQTKLALDLCLFINGLPVITFELKNSLTKQTYDDAIWQYRQDRDPKELLFQFGRCMVHFAVDDGQVHMCTHLTGKDSWFLPFNKGWNDGAGNPPNPHGLMTEYLWKEVLTRQGLAEIIENYAQVVEEKDPRTGKKRKKQIFLTHEPPFRAKIDKVDHGPAKGKHVGNFGITWAIKKYKPLLHFCGHIHESQGVSRIGKTLCINAGYGRNGQAVIVELENKKTKIKFVKH